MEGACTHNKEPLLLKLHNMHAIHLIVVLVLWTAQPYGQIAMHVPYIRPNLVTFEMKIPSLYQIFVTSIHADIEKKSETFKLTLLCPTIHYIHVRYIKV